MRIEFEFGKFQLKTSNMGLASVISLFDTTVHTFGGDFTSVLQ